MQKNIIKISKWLNMILFIGVVLIGIRNILLDIPSLLPIFTFYGVILLIIISVYKWKKDKFISYMNSIKKVKLNYFVIGLLILAGAMLFYDIIVIAIHYGIKTLIILCFILPYLYFAKKESTMN
ncbi:hypothetical protein [Thomasclavelia spiroformis]|uniref:hypothetical protein n=2 Tax=Thomasclavelia spiroformis TaxID=29348 RepID=UPI0026DD1A3C|nr:hypothetical protein [Thomasclavelia spiroformis]